MGFRSPLDLTVIVRDYEAFGGRPERHATGTPGPVPDVRKTEPPDHPTMFGRPDRLWASSCTVLAPFRPVIWDVNGYYAALGVDPHANRTELRRAYEALGGQEDSYLTYVLHQLLNRDVRRGYDATPLGEVYLDDIVTEELRKRAAATAGARSRKGASVSVKDVLDGWGYVILGEPESEELERLEDSQDSLVESPPRSFVSWGYSYYLWGTWDVDVSRLRTWQEALVAELSVRGYTVRFAVGIKAASEGGDLLYLDEDFIFFIEEGELPTGRMARGAVDAYIERIQSNTTDHNRTEQIGDS